MDHGPGEMPAVATRLAGLPRRTIGGVEVPVAASISARLLGLSHLGRDEAGPGLLIPRCRSVHTFGMRFALDIFFIDESDTVVRRCLYVPPGRCLFTGSAHSVLELVTAGQPGGEVLPPAP